MTAEATARFFLLHQTSPHFHLCIGEYECKYMGEPTIAAFRKAAQPHILSTLPGVDISKIQVQIYGSPKPSESVQSPATMVEVANSGKNMEHINNDDNFKALSPLEAVECFIVVYALCLRLRFLVLQSDNSPNGYIGEGELTVSVEQTVQTVEDAARSHIDRRHYEREMDVAMRVWKPRKPFEFSPMNPRWEAVPAQNECTMLRSDEKLGTIKDQTWLIVTPIVRICFLVLDAYSSSGKYLGGGKVDRSTGQTVQMVEDAARNRIKEWLGVKKDVEMQVWEPRISFDFKKDAIPALVDWARLYSHEELGTITNRNCLIVTPNIISFQILDVYSSPHRRIADGNVAWSSGQTVQIVADAAQNRLKKRFLSKAAVDLEVWEPTTTFDIRTYAFPVLEECVRLHSDEELDEIKNRSCLIVVPVFNFRIILMHLRDPESSCYTFIGRRDVTAPIEEVVRFVQDDARKAFIDSLLAESQYNSRAIVKVEEVTVYQPIEPFRATYDTMTADPSKFTLESHELRGRGNFSPCIHSCLLRDLGSTDLVVTLAGSIQHRLPFPFVVFEGGPSTYKYAGGCYKEVLSDETVKSIHAAALELCGKSHENLQFDIRVYEPTEALPEFYDKTPEDLKRLNHRLGEHCLEDITELELSHPLSHLSTKQTLIVVFRLADQAMVGVPTMHDRYRNLLDSVPSLTPSKSAQSREFARRQGSLRTAIFDGSYVTDGDKIKVLTIAPPIQIYHPIFQEFRDVVKSDSPLDPTIVDGVSKMVSDMGKIRIEKEGAASLREHLAKILGTRVEQVVTESRYADGLVSMEGRLNTIPMIVVEYKRSLGDGSCDPLVQASYSTLNYWTDSKAAPIRDRCCCPTFIVAGSGAYLAILGVVFTDRLIVQKLTDLMWCGEATVYDDSRVYHLARVFTALSFTRKSMEKYYTELVQLEPQPPPPTRPSPHPRFFPYPTQFKEGASTTEFRYIQPFSDGSTNVTFLAETIHGSGPSRKLVIKFVDRYGVGPHRLLADEEMAPKLLFCGRLDGSTEDEGQTDDPSSGLYLGPVRMVVMEWIDGETAAKTKKDAWPESARERVKEALTKLHKMGLVFGDLRGPNIMFQRNTNRVLLIDFDWSGQAGVVHYPRHLSKQVKWPEGVDDGKEITMEHDLAMLEELFGAR